MPRSSPYGKSVEGQGRIGNQELTRAALGCGCALGWWWVGEPDLRRGEPLKAVAAHAGMLRAVERLWVWEEGRRQSS